MAETVLLTGASSGIGTELARLFAADKAVLVLVARRVDKLEELARELRQQQGVDVHVLACDLSEPGAPARLCEQLSASGLSIDVLVNNAGFGRMDLFDRIPAAVHTQMINLNVLSVTELTRLLIPGMIARKRGQILNVGSTASFQPGPNAAVYYATKAFVLSFSEGLAEELRGTGVTVTCLCPGPTKTGFGEGAEMQNTILFKLAMPVGPVARGGYRALRRGKILYVAGPQNWFGAFCVRLLPRWLVRKLLKWVQPVAPRESSPSP